MVAPRDGVLAQPHLVFAARRLIFDQSQRASPGFRAPAGLCLLLASHLRQLGDLLAPWRRTEHFVTSVLESSIHARSQYPGIE